MKRLLLIAGAAMSLSGCALGAAASAVETVTSLVSSPSVVVVNGKVQLEGKRGLILASNAYQGASAVLVPLINADKLSPATVNRVDGLNKKAAALLAGTDRTLTLAQRTAAILGVADELSQIGGK